MISLNAKNLESALLAEPHVAVMFSCQRIAKGAGGKGPRQKTSKSVKKFFRHFSIIFAQGKKRKKSSKSVKKFFDTFRQFSRRAPFFRPLLGGGSCSLAEPLTRSAKVSCRTLQIAEPKALNSEKDYLFLVTWLASVLDS